MSTDSKLSRIFIKLVNTDKHDYQFSQFFSPRNFSLRACSKAPCRTYSAGVWEGVDLAGEELGPAKGGLDLPSG